MTATVTARNRFRPCVLKRGLDNLRTSTQSFTARPAPLERIMRQEQVLRQPLKRLRMWSAPSQRSVTKRRSSQWSIGALLATLLAQGCTPGVETREASKPGQWTSRAIPEARGEVKEFDGKRVQVRYREEPFSGVTANFEQWPTYAYTDTRTFPPPKRTSMPAVKGDAKRGRALFMSRAKGPCTGCHLIPGDDVWPAGSVGPDLSVIGDRRLPDRYLFDFIWDARVFLPNTSMPPWGPAGILSPDEIVHIVAFLQALKGNPPFVPPPEKDPTRNPHTRPRTPRTTATTWIPPRTRRSFSPKMPRRCGPRGDRRRKPAPTATRAARRRPCGAWPRSTRSTSQRTGASCLSRTSSPSTPLRRRGERCWPKERTTST